MKKLLLPILLVIFLSGCYLVFDEQPEIEQVVHNVTLAEAKEIALTHASVSKAEAKFEVEEMVEGEPSYYLLVIKDQDHTLLYKIDIASGKILLSSNQESDAILDSLDTSLLNPSDTNDKDLDQSVSSDPQPSTPSGSKSEKPSDSKPTTPSDTKTEKPAESQPDRVMKDISKDVALQIALKDLGISQSAIRKLEIERDREKNMDVWEVEFDYGDYEYEYDIAISDGKIIKMEIEYRFKPTGTGEISLAKAKELALARVKGANENHLRIKKDYDDGRLQYEGRIIYNGYEYEFEIDGPTGIFLEWEMEILFY